jgi:hypothetical protein
VNYYVQCQNCFRMVTITDRAAFHSDTGCVSCKPVEQDGFFSEPENFMTGPRVMA